MQLQAMLIGIGTIITGALMFIRPARARRVWRKRIAELQAGAREEFFEERRSLEAYPPLSTNTKQRMFAVLLILLGAATIVIGILS